MNVAKFIRILGYIVWVILWSPIIAFVLVASPIYWLVEWVLSEGSPIGIFRYWWRQVTKHLKRGKIFINEGEWCTWKEED